MFFWTRAPYAGKEAEPFSDARTVSGRSGDKTFFAGFAAEAQSPMMIGGRKPESAPPKIVGESAPWAELTGELC
jgi:hypothetical protein